MITWYDANRLQPINNEYCIIQLEDKSYKIDEQYMGEWSYRNVIRWCYLTPEFATLVNKMVTDLINNEGQTDDPGR